VNVRPQSTWTLAIGLVLIVAGVATLVDHAGWFVVSAETAFAIGFIVAGIGVLLTSAGRRRP
jgi:uncharacterized membrane protein HdeD (DUF308 family)